MHRDLQVAKRNRTFQKLLRWVSLPCPRVNKLAVLATAVSLIPQVREWKWPYMTVVPFLTYLLKIGKIFIELLFKRKYYSHYLCRWVCLIRRKYRVVWMTDILFLSRWSFLYENNCFFEILLTLIYDSANVKSTLSYMEIGNIVGLYHYK